MPLATAVALPMARSMVSTARCCGGEQRDAGARELLEHLRERLFRRLVEAAYPSVSSTISRCGFTAGGSVIAPVRPSAPRSPPAREAISIATCHMSSMQPACTPWVLMLVACRSPRLMPPCVGFSAKLPQ